jgi:hypothetical protein
MYLVSKVVRYSMRWSAYVIDYRFSACKFPSSLAWGSLELPSTTPYIP